MFKKVLSQIVLVGSGYIWVMKTERRRDTQETYKSQILAL